MNHYGYYLFLGLGDFKAPPAFDPEWTSTWDLLAWQRKIDDLVRLGTNTLFLYLMGHHLPYASARFPECVEENHPNVKNDYLQSILDRCKERKIEPVAVFSTTGHAKAYTLAHPEASVCDRAGNHRVHAGIMCHHQEDARKYPLAIIGECLGRYCGFSGIILHPPEFHNSCYCRACQERYQKAHGQSLFSASDDEARKFFMSTNLLFQKTVLEAEIRRRLPDCYLLTFTIPWIFQTQFEQIAREIDPQTIIVDWDYNLSEDRIKVLQSRLRRYQQFGHRVWFMPTSGHAFSGDKSIPRQADLVLQQIQLSLESDVRDIVYFVGPKWYPTVEHTSWHLHVSTRKGLLT